MYVFFVCFVFFQSLQFFVFVVFMLFVLLFQFSQISKAVYFAGLAFAGSAERCFGRNSVGWHCCLTLFCVFLSDSSVG